MQQTCKEIEEGDNKAEAKCMEDEENQLDVTCEVRCKGPSASPSKICSGCKGGKIEVEKESSGNKYKVSCIQVGDKKPTQLDCNDDTVTEQPPTEGDYLYYSHSEYDNCMYETVRTTLFFKGDCF